LSKHEIDMKWMIIVFALALTACAQVSKPTDGSSAEARKLHAMFDAAWEEGARDFPEWATYRGDHRFGDRLADMSAAAIAARDERLQQRLREARAIDRTSLNATDRVSLDMFIDSVDRQLQVVQFPGWRTMSLRALGGPHTQFADLLANSPVSTTAQVEQMLARMAAYPKRLDEEIVQLSLGSQTGWVASKDVLQRVLAQIDGQLPADVDKSPFYLY
jgi:uncharacterized protein (DUF885 family)